MDLGGMIPNPVVTSSSSSAAASTLLSFASAAATSDDAVRVEGNVENEDDDELETYHPTPSEGDNTEGEEVILGCSDLLQVLR